MDADSYFHVGYVIKKHGVQGKLKIYLDTSLPNTIKTLFIEQDNRQIPFFVENISILKNIAIIKFEDIDSAQEAEMLIKKSVFIDEKYLQSTSQPGDRTSVNEDIIGYRIIYNKKLLGTVKTITSTALNPLLVVTRTENEILIPAHTSFVKKIDEERREITVTLPENFLDL